MIKKIICLSLAILLLFTFVGCSDEDTSSQGDFPMFVLIEKEICYGYTYRIIYHKETKVMYALDHYNHFTVMVDADGKPLLYEEDLY